MANAFLQRLFGMGPGSMPTWRTPPFLPTSRTATTGVPMGGPPAWSTPPFLPAASGGSATASNPPAPVMAGPPWLQKLTGGFNRLAGVQNNPNLSPQENAMLAQQQRMAMTAALLQAAAPRPKGTGSPLADIGSAMFASQQAGGQFTADALRTKLMQAQIAQAQQGAQDPSTIREMRALGFPLTQEGFEAYNKAQARPGTTINLADKLNEPIPIAQLDTVRLPDGTTPPIGTTYAEAREMGAKVLSTADQQRTQQADQAMGILNQLEALAVGPEGVFNEVMPGIANRAAAAINFGLDMLEQKDPRASQFADMSKATLAPFIKFLGETGSLAQGDVERALGLVPRIFPLPDTGEVAKEKLDALREIITRGVNKMNSVTRQSQDVQPPPGFTLDK